MFKIKFSNGESIYALSHIPLLSRFRELEDVNFFKWQAYPERSYGVFLVSEESLIAAMSVGSPISEYVIELDFRNEDGSGITFSGVSIKSITSFNTGDLAQGSAAGERLLALYVELERKWTFEPAELTEGGLISHKFATWSELTSSLFDSGSLLLAPSIFNKHIYYDNIPIEVLAAEVANSQFLTAYPDNVTTDKAFITDDYFDPTYINQEEVVYASAGSTYKKITLFMHMPTDEFRFGNPRVDLAVQGTVSAPPTSGMYYTNAILNPDTVTFTYPWQLNTTYYSSGVTVNSKYFDELKTNALKRLSSRIDVTVQGISDLKIKNDIQCIEYRFHNAHGLVTTFKSKPWKLTGLNLLERSSNDIIFVARLIDNMGAGIAIADIFHPLNFVAIVDPQQLVYDPLGLVTRYCAGTRCYVARTYDGEYIIISGPCNPSTECTSSSSSSSYVG